MATYPNVNCIGADELRLPTKQTPAAALTTGGTTAQKTSVPSGTLARAVERGGKLTDYGAGQMASSMLQVQAAVLFLST